MQRPLVRIVFVSLVLVFALSSSPAASSRRPHRRAPPWCRSRLHDSPGPRAPGEHQRGSSLGGDRQGLRGHLRLRRNSLGQHWKQRTPAEQQEFVRLFTEVIQRSYVTRIDRYGGEKMVYRGETVDGGQAVVRTALALDDGSQLPIDDKMHHPSDRWQVYDINVEGVSLVANYRAQFSKVIRNESYQALVTRLKVNHANAAASAAGDTSPP